MRCRLLWALAVLVLLAGCGSGPPEGPKGTPRSAAGVEEQRREALDAAIDDANAAMLEAARQGDGMRLAAAERKLDDLARQDEPPPSAGGDAIERATDRIRFKQAPLFIQQVTLIGEGSRIYAGVSADQFCLHTPSDRRAAVQELYDDLDDYLRTRQVRDLELVVVPFGEGDAKMRDAIAIARGGKVRLRGRARTC